MNRRGFSIVELVVVITIIGILLTLAAISFRGYQAEARDEQRRIRAENIARYIETIYKTGSTNPDIDKGVYPEGYVFSGSYYTPDPNIPALERFFSKNGFDLDNLKSAGKDTYGFKLSADINAQPPSTSFMTPDYYVYQPVLYRESNGQPTRCWGTIESKNCRSFNLYYMTEKDNVIHTIKSIH